MVQLYMQPGNQRDLLLQVIKFEKRLDLVPIRQSESDGQLVEAAAANKASSADKWLTSLHKSISLTLANFSRGAARGLMRLLRSGNFTPDQARPGGAFLYQISLNIAQTLEVRLLPFLSMLCSYSFCSPVLHTKRNRDLRCIARS